MWRRLCTKGAARGPAARLAAAAARLRFVHRRREDVGETATPASGPRPFLQIPSCAPCPVRARCRFFPCGICNTLAEARPVKSPLLPPRRSGRSAPRVSAKSSIGAGSQRLPSSWRRGRTPCSNRWSSTAASVSPSSPTAPRPSAIYRPLVKLRRGGGARLRLLSLASRVDNPLNVVWYVLLFCAYSVRCRGQGEAPKWASGLADLLERELVEDALEREEVAAVDEVLRHVRLVHRPVPRAEGRRRNGALPDRF
eukprot:gene5950-biopygen16326